MGCFSPSRLWSKKSKIHSSAGPHEGRGEATNPVSFDYKLADGPRQLTREPGSAP